MFSNSEVISQDELDSLGLIPPSTMAKLAKESNFLIGLLLTCLRT